ncbi:MAG: hypothetical protein ACYDCK_05920, partial [Thermoplasmatota archaeon]
MAVPFADVLASWHDFYLFLGTAAATLVGLIFVSVTFNIDRLRGPDGEAAFRRAERTFASFLALIALSLLVLVPGLPIQTMAVSVATVGAVGAFRAVATFVRPGLAGDRPRGRDWVWRLGS